jgi:uncharacterized protein YraI
MRRATLPRLWLGGVLMLFSIAAMAENAVTTDVASVRAGPDNSYPEVAQLDADSPVQVMGCLDDWSWCDVAFGDNRGWLYSPDLSYEYEGGYVPFYSYAPAFGLPVVTFSLDAYWGSHYRGRPWYAQRDEWVHRTIQHQRPPGPAPSRAPPPREVVRAERPHGGSRPGEPMRLSKAEPSHGDDQRPAGRGPDVQPAPEKRSSPETRPRERAAAPPPDHAMPRPAEHAPPQAAERESRPAERAAPQREEQPAHPAERAKPPQHEETHAAPSKPDSPPRKEDDDHRG